jgi:hypothetical protein
MVLSKIHSEFFSDCSTLMHLLAKDAPFVFAEECLQPCHSLKKALISAPVIQPPVWHLPFEIMCDASDYAVGAVLDQSKDKKHHAISYTSKTLTGPQLNYTTTEKELVAMVFGGRQGHYLYRSCRSQVSLDKERCKTTPNLMDTSTPRI